jgi:NADH:ubiquinone oxidoreductase subunit 6 (subunit J)
MSVQEFLFWFVGLLTCACAVAVVVSQNIVRSAIWLLFTLAGTAGLYFLLGADFVGATQLFVYVGGTLVLVIFGVMLTAQGPFVNLRTGAGEWAITILVGLLLYGLIACTIFLTDWEAHTPSTADTEPRHARNSNDLGLALLGIEEATDDRELPMHPGHKRKRISYLLAFEIVSVHLVVVLIGAAYLARTKTRKGARTP